MQPKAPIRAPSTTTPQSVGPLIQEVPDQPNPEQMNPEQLKPEQLNPEQQNPEQLNPEQSNPDESGHQGRQQDGFDRVRLF